MTLEGQSRAAWHAGMRAVAHHARPTPADHRSLLRAPSPMCQLFQNEGLEDRSVLALSVSVFTLALHRSSYIFIFIYIKYLSVDRPPAFNVHDALWDSALGTRPHGTRARVKMWSGVVEWTVLTVTVQSVLLMMMWLVGRPARRRCSASAACASHPVILNPTLDRRAHSRSLRHKPQATGSQPERLTRDTPALARLSLHRMSRQAIGSRSRAAHPKAACCGSSQRGRRALPPPFRPTS